MFAMSLALMATRGWSFRSWRAYPKYGSTAVVRAALARRAASIRNSSSIQFSAGGLVGWMMKTSRPRTFSSILTKISPSAKRRIVTAQSGAPRRPQRPRGVRLFGRGEARGRDRAVALEQPGHGPRVGGGGGASLDGPGFVATPQGVAVLAALDLDRLHAVQVHGRDAL